MAVNDYRCGNDHEMRDRIRHPGLCSECGLEMKVSYLRWSTVRIPSSAITNEIFNNGQGEYDEGLGKVIFSRKHRREVMAEKGLVEVDKHDRDDLNKDFELKEEDGYVIADRLEKAEAMVRSGEAAGLTGPLG
tara:strand:- start:4404 stop:4802 length:399 start_codon:yes stop_codon:yes gene_type:complete